MDIYIVIFSMVLIVLFLLFIRNIINERKNTERILHEVDDVYSNTGTVRPVFTETGQESDEIYVDDLIEDDDDTYVQDIYNYSNEKVSTNDKLDSISTSEPTKSTNSKLTDIDNGYSASERVSYSSSYDSGSYDSSYDSGSSD